MHKIIASYKENQPIKKTKFIVDDMDDTDTDVDELDEEEEPSSDNVCAFCDNGGEILSCEGICMRSFHPTKDAGGGLCESLGFINSAQVEAIPVFLCGNCKYKKHQCFAGGRLGSSDMSCGREVFSCFSGTCGHFYHPKCVAELIHPNDKAQAVEVQKKIIAWEPFTCPVHRCSICHQIEDKTVHDLQLAVCRRCPKAYHRKCLPREISFENYDGLPARAWDGLLPNRILIYCMDHIIDPVLGTPARDHIKYPPAISIKKKPVVRLKLPSAGRNVTSGSCSMERAAAKIPKSAERTTATGNIDDPITAGAKHVTVLREPPSITFSAKRALHINQFTSSNDRISQVKKPIPLHSNSSLNLRPYSQKQQSAAHIGLDVDVADNGNQRTSEDNEMENRILTLMRESIASLDDEHKRKWNATDRGITLGRVEHYVKAIRTALQKLDEGSTIEEAKEICDPVILKQLFIWRKKLRVYLAPFLHAARYTSFGRHFTKSDKLKEIVNRLQWYVQNGDTIVDFCCGSNEFSLLLKEKLDKIGKRCSFKNYDLFPPQNTFCFEKRDWMSVDPKELPSGSKLIMGLNPPFGVKASLANKFIQKALEFKPKLLILIVLDETERLDTGHAPYDLIWRDQDLLSGKSFYLPGSIDVNKRQLDDWNIRPPSLYLWSLPNWTSQHKALAEKHGHLPNNPGEPIDQINPDQVEPAVPKTTDDMILDMEISSPEPLPISCIPEAPPSLPESQSQQQYPNLSNTPPVYSPYGYIQPPLPYQYSHIGQNFTYFSPSTSSSQNVGSPYNPFTDCFPATDPDVPK